VLEAANDQPPRLVIEFEEVDRTTFVQLLAPENRPNLRRGLQTPMRPWRAWTRWLRPKPALIADPRPLIVIDPGHGGLDNGTQAGGEVMEKNLVLGFGLALRDRIEKSGKIIAWS